MMAAGAMPILVTKKTLGQGLDFLAAKDSDLASVIEAHGPPPIWGRPAGFDSLVRIILEQQVSLASAKAAFDRLEAKLGRVEPDAFSTLDDSTLKRIGFSRQKAGYCRGLATAIAEGRFELEALAKMSDDEARKELTSLKGVGRWTADIYLLMVLRRADVWPTGDLALAKAAQEVKGLAVTPSPEDLEEVGSSWRPWRAVAARVLWHHYLSQPRATAN
jgi:DNA-3-methyladenine glycosylase II